MSSSIFDRKTFTGKHKKALDLFLSLSGVAIDDQNILMCRNTANKIVDESLPEYQGVNDDLDTFVVTTSADPENTISSSSVKNTIDLNVQDGGYF